MIRAYVIAAMLFVFAYLVWRWRAGNAFGLELRDMRAAREESERQAECCCEKEKKRKQAALEAGLRRRFHWKRRYEKSARG